MTPSRKALFEVELAGGAATRQWDSLAGDIGTSLPWETLRPEDYEPGLVRRAQVGWTENAFNEYCTAAAMGQLVQVMAQAGVPLDLLGIASTFAVEEFVHVDLCARVAMRLGGGAPIVYDPDDLHLSFDPDLTPLQRANELVVRLCCVGEEFSLPMLAGSMRAATHPVTRGVLTRIVRDESTHGRLGWLYLDWIAGTFDDAERARLYGAAVDTAGHIATLWEGPTRAVPPETAPPGFHDLGWMAPAAYVALARRTMEEEVFGRLRTYGIGS